VLRKQHFQGRHGKHGRPFFILCYDRTMISRRQFLRGRFSAPATSSTRNDPTAPQLAVIGVGCIALAQNVVCRSCGDACGEAAIRFSPRLDGAACPVILTGRCTACGACVPACPASAITLAGQVPK
jgi:formate hydrogenlyase subunit 6/NADH:ubiquinone oxidoreductase subunit I